MVLYLFLIGLVYFLITGRLELRKGVGIYRSRARYTALLMVSGIFMGAVLINLMPDAWIIGGIVQLLSMIAIPVAVYYYLRARNSPYIYAEKPA
jgi:uncharacterized membrane protein YjjP (DUF1212 family)